MTKTIQRTWTVDDVLTSVTTAKLSDATGAFGVKRTDTDAVVVADGTAMTESSTGVYTYSFTEPATGLAYEAWVEFVYGGNTYRFEHDFAAVVATETGATYTSLSEAVGYYLGYWSSADGWTISTASQHAEIGSIITRGLHRFYLPPPIRPRRYGHRWSFLRPQTTLTMVADTSEYDLPSDFAGLESRISFASGQTVLYEPIQQVSEFQVRQRLSEYTGSGRPYLFAIRPKTVSYSTGTRWEALFYPTPDSAYSLEYRYRVGVEAISAANPYPPGGTEHAATITEACLAEAEVTVNDTAKTPKAVHESRFKELLRASISHDQLLSTPPHLGYNVDRSDIPGRFWGHNWHELDQNFITHNGVSY